MSMVRYPLPITAAMLLPANQHITKPRYDSVGAPSDWSGGAVGNQEDVATATSAITDATGVVFGPYAPKTLSARAALKGMPIVDDLGIDYGPYAGQAGRTGPVTPQAPYPDSKSAPLVVGVSPNTGLAAGGTPVTISGAGFTGATTATFGGPAASAMVVVNSNTITCTTPAHAAGTVDVRVTTPNGTSANTVADNFIYT